MVKGITTTTTTIPTKPTIPRQPKVVVILLKSPPQVPLLLLQTVPLRSSSRIKTKLHKTRALELLLAPRLLLLLAVVLVVVVVFLRRGLQVAVNTLRSRRSRRSQQSQPLKRR